MKCPFCNTLDTKVIDSRMNQTGDLTRRRRECPECEGRFTTYEKVEEVMPAVIKKDGRREPYERGKILEGLRKACQKRSVTTQRRPRPRKVAKLFPLTNDPVTLSP